ncbi:MAG: hypothetical protein V1866_03225 [archaeon]
MLINDFDVKICDYDLAVNKDEIKREGVGFHVFYQPKEGWAETMPSVMGDLESFALMIDHLLIGEAFLPTGPDFFNKQKYVEEAKEDYRSYPDERYMLLPEKLRQVVAPLITYPRDESIKLDDFIEAIALDYGIKIGPQ